MPDEERGVLGTVTDGDIWRGFINGALVTTDMIVEIYTKNYTFLSPCEGVSKAIEIFKNGTIKFLPVVDGEKKLVNIITKNQLYTLMIQDIHAELGFGFMNLDEGLLDYKIYQRPWGFYKTTVMNDYFQSKVICVNPNAQLSLQSHNHRDEHQIVAHSTGTVQLDQSVIVVNCGSSIFIPKD